MSFRAQIDASDSVGDDLGPVTATPRVDGDDDQRGFVFDTSDADRRSLMRASKRLSSRFNPEGDVTINRRSASSTVTELQLPLVSGDGNAVDDGIMGTIKTSTAGELAGFNHVFFRRLFRMLGIGFRSPFSGMSFVLYMNMGMNILVAWLLIYIQVLVGPTVKAIAEKDMSAVLEKLLVISSIGMVGAIGTSIIQTSGARLAIEWRDELVKYMQKEYFHGKTMYYMNALDRRVDNTDQRMTQDADNFVTTAGQLLFGSFSSSVSLTYVLTSLGFALYKTAGAVNGESVMYLSVFAVGCMLITTIVVIPVVRATFRANQSRGFFRFTHARIKEYAEAIVFYGGQQREGFAANENFVLLYWRWRSFYKRQFLVNVWNAFQTTFSSAFSVLTIHLYYGNFVVTPENRGDHLSQLTSLNGLLGVFMAACILIPSLLSQFGPLAGYTHRLGQFMDAMDQLKVVEEAVASTGHAIKNSGVVAMQNMTCMTPDGKPLFKDLTYTVNPSESVVIMGASGVGKSSLLRIIGGLWPFDAGSVHRPMAVGRGGCLFLPQRTYITAGSLRQQVVYPLDEAQATHEDAHIKKILDDVQLTFLYDEDEAGLDRVSVWQDILSGGEQQRLGFARLLYHAPMYAIMDESTSALDVELERSLMERCVSRGITCISVGHRPTLLEFHTHVMKLNGRGGFELEDAANAKLDPALVALATGASVPLPTVGEVESKDDVEGDDAGEDSRARRATLVRSLELRSSTEVVAPQKPLAQATVSAVSSSSPLSKPLFDIPKVPADVRVDREFMRRFWRLVRSGFPTLCSKSTLMLLASFVVTIASQFVTSLLSLESPKLLSDLSTGEYSAFTRAFLVTSVLMAISAVLTGAASWFGYVISLYWYRALVEDTHSMYFRNKTAYAVNQLAPGLDNVDQRVCADAYDMTTQIGGVLFGGAKASFFGVLVQIGLSIYFAAPYGWLPIVVAIVWSVIGIALTACAMQPVVPWTYKKNACEGDFRQTHARIREFMESITFYDGQTKELATAGTVWQKLFDTYKKLVWVTVPVATVANMWTVLGGFVTFAIYVLQLAIYGFPAEFSATVLFTQVTLLGQLMSSVSSIPSYMSTLASVAGLAHRVGQLLDTADAVLKTYERFDKEHRVVKSGHIELVDVSCTTPDGHPLFKNMTFAIRRQESMLIMGPSGAGKSSLLRLMAGLWPFQEGVIKRPFKIGHGGMFFVPQRPYLIENGTLRDQLIYPHTQDYMRTDDARLVELLRAVDLNFVLERAEDGLDTRAEWGEILSGGEQQRVGFVRLLYHRPVFAIMDESTSALDVPLEQRCMELCVDANITCISVGHRLTLIPFHKKLLRLDGAGGFEVQDVAEVMAAFHAQDT